jgi:hypothetical protein
LLEFTKSQKSTVRYRRSPGSETPIGTAPEFVAVAPSANAAPHSSQNFAPGKLKAPQAEHFVGKDEAHSLQNLAPARLSFPHLEHCIL